MLVRDRATVRVAVDHPLALDVSAMKVQGALVGVGEESFTGTNQIDLEDLADPVSGQCRVDR